MSQGSTTSDELRIVVIDSVVVVVGGVTSIGVVSMLVDIDVCPPCETTRVSVTGSVAPVVGITITRESS
jgi:hypothetical protein